MGREFDGGGPRVRDVGRKRAGKIQANGQLGGHLDRQLGRHWQWRALVRVHGDLGDLGGNRALAVCTLSSAIHIINLKSVLHLRSLNTD